jgi:hypothetical protein
MGNSPDLPSSGDGKAEKRVKTEGQLIKEELEHARECPLPDEKEKKDLSPKRSSEHKLPPNDGKPI